MATVPWGLTASPFEDFYSPWSPLGRMERMGMERMGMDPFMAGRMDPFMRMGMAAPMRQMENELGKLISSVKEDEDSFQVIEKTIS